MSNLTVQTLSISIPDNVILDSARFTRSLAVIIGINAYCAEKGIPRLQTAGADATRLAEIMLYNFGYDVILLADEEIVAEFVTRIQEREAATKHDTLPTAADGHGPIPRTCQLTLLGSATLEALHGLLVTTLPNEVQEKTRLLFYFAGHGIALPDKAGPTGYLIPQNAIAADSKTFLPMHMVHTALTALPCHHCLIILDCCFAGAFRWSGTRRITLIPPVLYQEQYDRFLRSAAWQVIASAAYDQEALEALNGAGFGIRNEKGAAHSPFASALFTLLTGEEKSSAAEDGVLIATDLYSYLRKKVEREIELSVGLPQTPVFWLLEKHEYGEYIFLLDQPQLTPAPKPTKENNPYRGLEPYEKEHARLFFGRSEQIEQLAKTVEDSPFVLVLGASGTGKSSLVKAGVIPFLESPSTAADAGKSGSSEHSAQPWKILPVMRPGDLPLLTFTHLLASELSPTTSQATANEILGQWGATHPNQRLLLVIDQFEELITFRHESAEQLPFVEALLQAASEFKDWLHVVVTLRSDFEEQIQKLFDESAERMPMTRYIVPPLSQSELRQVIERPATLAALYFQPPALVDELIDEVLQMPGALPLLSFTLSELYMRYLGRYLRGETEDRALLEQDYRELGGVIGSLRNRAEEEYSNLPSDEERMTMQRVMLRMVAIEGGELVRRRVPLSELVYPSDKENQRVALVRQRLEDARLIVSGSQDVDSDGSADAYIEPAHDALIQAWDRLLLWKSQAQEYLPLQRRLTQQAGEWTHARASGEDGSGLLWNNNPRLPRLQQEIMADSDRFKPEWLSNIRQGLFPTLTVGSKPTWLNEQESLFVIASVKRKATIWRRIAGSILIVIIALSILTLFAEYQARIANVRELAAQANLLNEQSPNLLPLSMAVDINSLQVSHSIATELYLRQGLQLLPKKLFSIPNVDRINSVTVSPDGKYIATASGFFAYSMTNEITYTGEIQVASIETGNVEFRQSVPYAKSVQFDRTGRFLAVTINVDVDVDGLDTSPLRVEVWDLATRQKIVDVADSVNAVAFSPTEERIATASNKGKIMTLRNYESHEITKIPIESEISGMRYSPDGKTLATWGRNSSDVTIWDAKTAAQVHKIPFARDAQNVVFDGTGRWLASFTAMNVIVADVANNYKLMPIVPDGSVSSIAFSPDGNWFAIGMVDGSVVIWDTKSWRRRRQVKHALRIADMIFSPNSEWLATASNDGTARIWSVTSGRELARMNHDTLVNSLAFSPDGLRLITGGVDSFTNVWETKVGGPEFAIDQPSDVNALVISPNDQWAALEDADSIVLWKLGSGENVLEVACHKSLQKQPRFSPNNKWLALDCGSEIDIFDMTTDTDVKKLPYDGSFWDFIVSPNGKWLAAAGFDHKVHIWETEGWREITPLEINGKDVESLAFSQDSSWLAAGGLEELQFWEVDNWEKSHSINYDGWAHMLVVSPDGKLVALAGGHPIANTLQMQMLEVATGKILWSREVPRLPGVEWYTEFSPDSKMVSLGANVLMAQNGQSVFTFGSIVSIPLYIRFSPDGLWATDGKEIRDAKSWRIVTRISRKDVGYDIGTYFPGPYAFTHDGESLLTADGQTARIWQLNKNTTGLIDRACRRLGQNNGQSVWQQNFPDETYPQTCAALQNQSE